MGSKKFMFDKGHSTLSLGRNGTMTTIGVYVWRPPIYSTTTIAPINGKGSVGRCNIEIPIESCPYAALEAVMTQKKLLPLLMGLHPLLDQYISETLSKEPK
jgi:hypothetical protein